ncbi:MAG: tyrosine-type recombinase/integrase [Pseudonocardiaceae bacterium]
MAHIQDRWYREVPDAENPRRKNRIPTARHGIGMRYKVRYLTPSGEERSHAFPDGQLKTAKEWKAQRESDLARGTYVDPRAGKIRLRDFAAQWLASLDVDESSRENLEVRFRRRVLPYFGDTELGEVKPSGLRSWDRWLRDEGLSERYRHTLFCNLSAMFTAAVDDDLVPKSPFAGKSVKKPIPAKHKVIPWPEAQVWAVQRALRPRFAVTVDLGAGLGLRQGECFGLAVDDIDFLRGVVHVQRQVKYVRGKHAFAPPKYGKTRDVPLSEPVNLALAEHLRRYPPITVTLPWEVPGGPEQSHRLVLSAVRGGVVDAHDFNEYQWKSALRGAGVSCGRYENGMHQLRHFFAAVLLDQGESIKAVAEWLGHSDTSFTLKTYTHLMPSSTERTKGVIGSLYSRRDASQDPDGPYTAQEDQVT